LEKEQVQELLKKVQGWNVSSDNKQISKNLQLPDFMSAIRYFQKIADVAEVSTLDVPFEYTTLKLLYRLKVIIPICI
jgi:pterin-4a-carbinolamine dehydratase